MPQEHHVLRCVSCETFQVHIVKKTNKWDCKICGIKQSVKRNYGRGSGKDCRNQVMKLNELRVLKNSSKSLESDVTLEKTFTNELREPVAKKPSNSKWSEYLEESTADGGSESEDGATNCLSEITGRKKKRGERMPNNSRSSKKICRNLKTSELLDGCGEINCLFPAVNGETFKSDYKKYFTEAKIEKSDHKKYSTVTKSELKYSKYVKYMDEDDGDGDGDDDDDDDDDGKEDNNDARVNRSSNIFGSDLVDLDNTLDF